MDRYDKSILNELQNDGRISNQDLADKVGLSPAACWRRVKALEQQGTIEKYTAILNPDAVDANLCIIALVTLLRHSVDHSNSFEKAMSECPEVQQCFAVTGITDFILKIRVKDIKAYDRFLNEKIFILEGISQVQSNFALREIKSNTRILV